MALTAKVISTCYQFGDFFFFSPPPSQKKLVVHLPISGFPHLGCILCKAEAAGDVQVPPALRDEPGGPIQGVICTKLLLFCWLCSRSRKKWADWGSSAPSVCHSYSPRLNWCFFDQHTEMTAGTAQVRPHSFLHSLERADPVQRNYLHYPSAAGKKLLGSHSLNQIRAEVVYRFINNI